LAKKNRDKYDLILDAAIKVMAKYGYHRTRVSQIAREAGVADGTVYLYFHKKEDILISLFREMMETFVSEIQEQLPQYPSFQEKINFIINYHLQTLGESRDRAMVIQIELRQCDSEMGKKIFAPLRKYFNVIEEVIHYGQNTGPVRQDVDIHVARKVVFGALDEVVTRWVMSRKNYSLPTLAEPVIHIIMNGISPAPYPDH